MSQIFDKIKSLIESVEIDVNKFYDKNNKTAGTRVRKGMQELKNLAQDLRKDIHHRKNKM